MVEPISPFHVEEDIFQAPNHAHWSCPSAQIVSNPHQYVRAHRDRILIQLPLSERGFDKRPEVNLDTLVCKPLNEGIGRSYSTRRPGQFFVGQSGSDKPFREQTFLSECDRRQEFRGRIIFVHVAIGEQSVRTREGNFATKTWATSPPLSFATISTIWSRKRSRKDASISTCDSGEITLLSPACMYPIDIRSGTMHRR